MGIKSSFTYLVVVASLLMMSCSTTTWVVVDEEAMDNSDFEIISSEFYLESTNGITPVQPLIHFDIKAIKTYEYAQRVKTERYIQRYRPRLGFVLLGLAGAGLSTYAAYSDQLLTQPTNPQRYALLGAGGLLTGLSFMNMKPVGEPSKTGESRLLRSTGTIQDADTVNALPYSMDTPSFKISYKDSVISENNALEFNEGRITINLAEEIDASIFGDDPDESIFVEAVYDSLHNSKEVPVSSIFEQFVVVEAQITALRNEPSNTNSSILTDLAEGSQLELVERDGDWYKVLYGISETWVSVNDVQVIWRPSEFAGDLSVIAVPNVPFGSVDVERNIPVLGMSSLNSSAFIFSNFHYEGELSERTYGERDTKLMEEYFIQAFGIRGNNIVKATNISSDRLLDRAYSRLANGLQGEDQNLTVYLSGYAEIRGEKVYMLGTSMSEENEMQYIDLHEFFRALNNLNLNSLIIFADLDFRNEDGSAQTLEELASVVTSNNSRSAVIFGASHDQRSGIYTTNNGPQNRHSIFTYYLAEAIKEQNMSMEDIMDHLERNVPFTSRSIYDRPQNPLFFGNRQLELLN
ncbi:MAG: SH3 domain-containing protein [Gracilimonas sp.]